MKKHAYLIIAHKLVDNLVDLIRSIDDERNDIYIHIDKSQNSFDDVYKPAALNAANKSAVRFVPRMRVEWGRDSQIKCELALIEYATNSGEQYEYLHLLSGQDMAIKTPNEIHEFFDRENGKEFMSFCGMDWNRSVRHRVEYRYGTKGKYRFPERAFVAVQRILHISRLKNADFEIVGGSNWASITSDFAKYLLKNTDIISKTFFRSMCADELYKHSLAYNGKFRNAVYLLKIPEINDNTDPDMNRANMRYIDWVRGNPYIFRRDDFDELMKSECCFARKFDNTVDAEITKMILKELNMRKASEI